MPQNENLSDVVRTRTTEAIDRLNRILKSLDKDPSVPLLAITYVEIDKLNSKLHKLVTKLPTVTA